MNGDFTFGADSLQIEKGNASTTYRYADKSTIKTVDKNIKFPEPEVKFTLTEYDLQTVIDMARILSYPDLKISSSGENMYLSVVDKKVAGSNTFDLDLGIGNGDTFEMLMKVDLLKLFKGNYDVEISRENISHFKHHNLDLEYWIALEADSKYNGQSVQE